MKKWVLISVYSLGALVTGVCAYQVLEPPAVHAVTCCNTGSDCGSELCCDPMPLQAPCSPTERDYCVNRKQC